MLISEHRKFIFIHIYKNAGTSITAALMPFALSRWQRLAGRMGKRFALLPQHNPQPLHSHVKASEIVDGLGRDAFDAYFSFAFVRNPWDWQVSLYKYMLKETSHHQHDFVKTLGSFEQYIRWRCDREVRFQKDFLCGADGRLLVDFVGRYENLYSDFQVICSRIGVSASLPKLNVSNSRPYREFYTDETRELVRRAFEADIRLFGYDF